MAMNTDYLIGAATMLMFAAIGMYTATLLPVALRPSLVGYDIVWSDDVSAVCPGEVYRMAVRVTVHGESVLEVINVFLDAETYAPVPVTNPFFDVRLRAYPRDATYEQPISWVVPDVPPGDYIRITAATLRYADAEPTFLELPFSVKEGCE